MKRVLMFAVPITFVLAAVIGVPVATSANPGPPAIIFELLCPGAIEVEPQMAGGNLVRCFDIPGATETPTPTDTPIPPTATPILPTSTPAVSVCSTTVFTNVFVGDSVIFTIENQGTTTVDITRITMSWAGSGKLVQIVFDGLLVKSFVPPAVPVVSITSAEFENPAILLAGQPSSLNFDFDITGPTVAHTMTLELDGVCNIVDSR